MKKIEINIVLWIAIGTIGIIIGLAIGILIGFYSNKFEISWSKLKDFVTMISQIGTFLTFLFLVKNKMSDTLIFKQKKIVANNICIRLRLLEEMGNKEYKSRREEILSELDLLSSISTDDVMKQDVKSLKDFIKRKDMWNSNSGEIAKDYLDYIQSHVSKK
ncbi:hypothetical protein [Ligilactobacillus agilis]|uniref:hypothetical protein n=1 Tax=Ligilactobacillus agilis TaxID=1601 RepID=UPI003D8091A9